MSPLDCFDDFVEICEIFTRKLNLWVEFDAHPEKILEFSNELYVSQLVTDLLEIGLARFEIETAVKKVVAINFH